MRPAFDCAGAATRPARPLPPVAGAHHHPQPSVVGRRPRQSSTARLVAAVQLPEGRPPYFPLPRLRPLPLSRCARHDGRHRPVSRRCHGLVHAPASAHHRSLPSAKTGGSRVLGAGGRVNGPVVVRHAAAREQGKHRRSRKERHHCPWPLDAGDPPQPSQKRSGVPAPPRPPGTGRSPTPALALAAAAPPPNERNVVHRSSRRWRACARPPATFEEIKFGRGWWWKLTTTTTEASETQRSWGVCTTQERRLLYPAML